ncbi:MAG: STAS domain-containing protein, partial [Gemmataceae bacterium]
HGLPIRRAAEELLGAGARQVRVDLRDCTYMDSTFLGTLLTLRKMLDARALGPLTLVTPSTPCAKIIHEMGLGDFIPATDAPHDADAAWVELAVENLDPGSFRRNVTQAHEELAALPGQAGEQFRAVIRCLSQADAKRPAE